MTISQDDLHDDLPCIVSALRIFFWGGMLYILDFSTSTTANGYGWRFDFLNDAVAMLMIIKALGQLRTIHAGERYTGWLRFVSFIAILALLEAIHDHLVYPIPPVLSFLFNVLGLAKLAAVILFCMAMRQLCVSYGLNRSTESWRTTITLFAVIYCIPLGLSHAFGILAIISGTEFNYNWTNHDGGGGLGGLLFLVLLIFWIPLIHFFISTSRMQQEADGLSGFPPAEHETVS